ncbi:MAG: hypothetical protein V9H26_05010 [Verrucomicrobiota bacterium]
MIVENKELVGGIRIAQQHPGGDSEIVGFQRVFRLHVRSAAQPKRPSSKTVKTVRTVEDGAVFAIPSILRIIVVAGKPARDILKLGNNKAGDRARIFNLLQTEDVGIIPL